MGEIILGCSLVLLILVLLFIREKKKNDESRYINYQINPYYQDSSFINNFHTPIKRQNPFYYYYPNYRYVNQNENSLNKSGNSTIVNNSFMKNIQMNQNKSFDAIEEENLLNRINYINGIKSNIKGFEDLDYEKKNNNFKTIKMEDYLNPNIKFL